MTTYYVRKTGNDGAAGTSPATAWETLGKALGAAGISSGDKVYLGAGVYRECVTCALTSPVAETFIIGDVDGSQTGDAGEIRITNYLTNDKTLPTNQSLIDLNGCSHLTFESITFHYSCSDGTSGIIASKASSTSQYIIFRNCCGEFSDTSISAWYFEFRNLDPAALSYHNLIENCRFFSAGGDTTIWIDLEASGAADYDADFIVRNCTFVDMMSSSVVARGQQAGTGFGGGIIVRNCTSVNNKNFMFAEFELSTSIPCKVLNCVLIYTEFGALSATNAGTLIEDYNFLFSSVPYGTVPTITPGTNTISGMQYAGLFQLGQELFQGLRSRPFLMPTADSPVLGFGDDGSAPTVDILNRPRPAGGQSILKTIGAYERHDTGAKEISVVDSSPASVKIVGPGDHDFYIPVDAVSTTISIKARYDTNHGAGNKPQVILLAAPEIGITTETKTMTSAANTWEALSFAAQTPTAKGVVIIRCISRAAAGNGIAYFDTVTVS